MAILRKEPEQYGAAAKSHRASLYEQRPGPGAAAVLANKAIRLAAAYPAWQLAQARSAPRRGSLQEATAALERSLWLSIATGMAGSHGR